MDLDQTHEPIFTPIAPDAKWTVCRRYEIISEYLREIARPLNNLEQRAFLYLLDLEADPEDRYAHSLVPGECICMEILPAIIHALEPDPVDGLSATRNLDNQSCPARRFHTEKIGKFQGIVVDAKTSREQTVELRKRACELLQDVDTIARELLGRKHEYPSGRAMLAGEFPKLLELAHQAQTKTPRRRPEAVVFDWKSARRRLDVIHQRGQVELQRLGRTLARWGIC